MAGKKKETKKEITGEKSNEQESSILILSRLNESRMKKHFCDFVVGAENKEFLCHKLVLSSLSEYFNSLFTTKLSDGCISETTLKDTSAEIFEIILEFAYTGKLAITLENAFALLKNGDFFGIELLVRRCKRFIFHNPMVKNLWDVLIYAHHPMNDEDFAAVVVDHIATNFDDVLDSPDFLRTPFDLLNSVLKMVPEERNGYCECCDCRHILTAVNDEQFRRLIKWIEYDPDDRVKHFVSLATYAGLHEDFQNPIGGLMKYLLDKQNKRSK